MQNRNRSTSRKRFSPTRQSIGKFLNSELNCSNNRFEERNNNSNKFDRIKSTTSITNGTEHSTKSVAKVAQSQIQRASRVSILQKPLFRTISKYDGNKRNRGRATPKCVKHSPRLAPRPQPRIEVFEFEQEQWQKAYRTMGELYTVTIHKVPYGDIIREVPFHCAPVQHEFKAQYGFQNQFVASTTHDVPQKKDREYTFTSRMQMPFLRPIKRYDTVDKELHLTEQKNHDIYIPMTAVKVIFPTGLMSFQAAWRMMMPFGPIECCLIEGINYILVVYEVLTDANDAVSSDAYPHGVNISWLDKRLYNRGHFMEHQHYRLDQDLRWTHGLEGRWRTQGMITAGGSQLLPKKTTIKTSIRLDSPVPPRGNSPVPPRRNSPAMPRRNSQAAPQRNSPAAPRRNSQAAPMRNSQAASRRNSSAASRGNSQAAP